MPPPPFAPPGQHRVHHTQTMIVYLSARCIRPTNLSANRLHVAASRRPGRVGGPPRCGSGRRCLGPAVCPGCRQHPRWSVPAGATHNEGNTKGEEGTSRPVGQREQGTHVLRKLAQSRPIPIPVPGMGSGGAVGQSQLPPGVQLPSQNGSVKCQMDRCAPCTCASQLHTQVPAAAAAAVPAMRYGDKGQG